MDIERILGTDSGKVALEKTDRNMIKSRDEINKRTIETYSSYPQMGFSAPFTSIDDMMSKLPHACIFECNIQDNFTEACLKDKSQFPLDWGILRVFKRYIYRADLTFHQGEGANMNNAKMFYSWYRAEASPSHAWKEVSTTETTNITLLNGWSNYGAVATISKCGGVANVTGRIRNGAYGQGTEILKLPFPLKAGQLIIQFYDSTGTTIGGGIITGNSFTVNSLSTNVDVSFNFTYCTN